MYVAVQHDQPIGYTRGNSEFTAYVLGVVLAHLSFKKKGITEDKERNVWFYVETDINFLFIYFGSVHLFLWHPIQGSNKLTS